jgi:hypothetical protein
MIYPKRLQTLRQNARCWLALCGLFLALGLQISDSQAQPQPFIRADRLGIAHISAASPETPDERYQQALLLGAGWNRWPLYWNWVEPEPGRWQWEDYDRQVRRDLEHGLSINAILLGRPEFYADGRRIQGLYEPIFADGSDRPGPDKALNPANPWAVFAFQAANRYRPGGVLARQAELPPGTGISVWEVWNEPDLSLFWSGSPRDYARLLKVAYIVIKSVDPGAQVMVGGLLYPDEDINWLAQVLNLYTGDAMAPSSTGTWTSSPSTATPTRSAAAG